MKKEPSWAQIITALEIKAHAQKEIPLEPNELTTTIKLLEYLASLGQLAEEHKGFTLFFVVVVFFSFFSFF
jgi:hypothetical protein